MASRNVVRLHPQVWAVFRKELTEAKDIHFIWKYIWNKGRPTESKYWEDIYHDLRHPNPHNLLTHVPNGWIRLVFPLPRTITHHRWTAFDPAFLHGFYTVMSALQSTTTLHLLNRHQGSNGQGLGGGSSSVKKVTPRIIPRKGSCYS